MASIVKKPQGGSTGKRYVNTHYGTPLFGKQQGFAPTARAGANPRAGMSYSVGLDGKGRVVHIYRDGERIVMHKHAIDAAPPHPSSFGGMAAPPDEQITAQGQATLDNLQAQAAAAASNRAHHSAAQDALNQAAMQAALAHFSGS